MGITNNIPPSRLIQPGVIDNAAARPASPFEGQCIFQKDTDQLLVWNGTAWVMPNKPAQNPDGLELITSGALSGTATNFANCFTSTYDNYLIKMNGVFFSSTGDLFYRYLNNTTPTSGLQYRWAYRGYNAGGGTMDSSQNSSTLGFAGYSTGTFTEPNGVLTIEVFTPKLVNRTIIQSQAYGYISEWFARVGGSQQNDNASYDGIQFLTNSAVTMSGTVAIYGYRK